MEKIIKEAVAALVLIFSVTVPGLAMEGKAPPPPTSTPTPTATATPTPQPTATPAPVSRSGPRYVSINELYRLATAAGFPPGTRDYVVAVALCESSGYTHAVGKVGERGLMQIHPVHPEWTRAFDPVVNMQAAYRISKGGTYWSPWPNCP